MTIQINRNIYWSELFVRQLKEFGINQVCISPGSRSTPLTYAFAVDEQFEKFVCVDERSSAYFALGLAKKSKKPVAVVTTSGTAVAELYPAIIEAYNQRIPLIICTADRPHHLRNTGANQTINQEDIYSNHIRYFYDCGLPEVNNYGIEKFLKYISKGIQISSYSNKGPVHFNFPFEKPFEPDNYTDEIKTHCQVLSESRPDKPIDEIDPEVIQVLQDAEKVIAILGPNNFEPETLYEINKFCAEKNIPLFADSTSGLRFAKDNKIIRNQVSFLKTENLVKPDITDVLLLLGEAPVSNSTLAFIEKNDCVKISINRFGDLKDPSRTVNRIIKTDENTFLQQLGVYLDPKSSYYINYISSLDNKCDEIRKQSLKEAEFKIESWISECIINHLPCNSNLFIGNSTVIRDFDLFSGSNEKDISVYSNRGTSGIDGNIATALGIARNSNKPTFIVLGDLSFFHDSNSLLIASQNNIPLNIILINNNGGGIFSMLPISEHKNVFDKYFNTPLNLDFEHYSKLHGGNYYRVNEKTDLSDILDNKINTNGLNIIEIITDSILSASFRKEYINRIKKILNDN